MRHAGCGKVCDGAWAHALQQRARPVGARPARYSAVSWSAKACAACACQTTNQATRLRLVAWLEVVKALLPLPPRLSKTFTPRLKKTRLSAAQAHAFPSSRLCARTRVSARQGVAGVAQHQARAMLARAQRLHKHRLLHVRVAPPRSRAWTARAQYLLHEAASDWSTAV